MRIKQACRLDAVQKMLTKLLKQYAVAKDYKKRKRGSGKLLLNLMPSHHYNLLSDHNHALNLRKHQITSRRVEWFSVNFAVDYSE